MSTIGFQGNVLRCWWTYCETASSTTALC